MIFKFNPVWWLCVAILVAGLVMSSRMFLRQHTLAQVLCGTLVGILCGYFGIVMM
jgi:membrane-associated phospholipid phosphatase